jgi:Na+/H+-dicarboxylate symporter
MCAQHHGVIKKNRSTSPFIYLLMICLGILAGLSGVEFLKQLGVLISEVFVNLFKCISLPVIALSIIVTLAQNTFEGGMKSVWARTMRYTLSTTVVAAGISCVIYLMVQPSVVQFVDPLKPVSLSSNGYMGYLMSIVPSNALTPFLEQQVMAVLLLSIVVGFAVRHIPDVASKDVMRAFFKALHGLFLVITRWIICIIPIGLFGFITTTVAQLQAGMELKGIGEYLFIIVCANLVQGFVILPLWLRTHNIKPFAAMRAMLPALSVAFFSKSSVGTLPMTMNTIENNLAVKPEISRFVLPLCTSINMNGCAAFIFVTVMYLMQNHGITITYPLMGIWILIATVAAIGNAGVPMGCFFLSTSLLVSMNVPITLMGVILPSYTLIDMLETALNVWSDACVTKVVNDREMLTQSDVIFHNSHAKADNTIAKI